MKNKKSFVMAILFLSMLVMAILPANAQIISVIEIEKDMDTFTPIVIGENSYYIIGSSDLERPYDVYYKGITGTDVDAYFGTSESYNSYFSTYLDPGERLIDDITTANRRSRVNPFLDPLGDPLPKLFRLDNLNAKFTATQLKPFSLHMNYSFTFLAEGNVEYVGLLQSSEPVYLDVEIHNVPTISLSTVSIAEIAFGSADPAEMGLYGAKSTVPVFPKESTTNFTFMLTASGPPSSLVTFTPRPFRTFNVANGYEYVDFEEVNKTVIPVNSTYIGHITQGNFENITAGFIEPSENNIFSVRYFTLPIVKDNEYRIFVNIEEMPTTLGQLTLGGVMPPFLIDGDMTNPSYEELSGTLGNAGLRIRALETTDLVIALPAIGVVRADYAIFFNQVTPLPENVEPLTLNTPVQLYEDIMYEFTLAQPVMMAINYSAVDQDVEFYKLSDGEWEYVTFTSSATSFLDHIPGNVYTDVTGTLDERWFYIPAGTYAVKTDDAPQLDDEIQFNTITVQTFSDSTTLNVNQNSLFAVQLPLTYHHYNNYSLSTADHINQSVWYDFFIKGKYDEIIGTISTSTIQMGNQEISGIWQDWNTNDTQIYDIIPARTNEIPILVLRPVQATQNVSNPADLVDTFTANLTITHTVPANYYPDFAVTGFSSYGVGAGYFIPISTPVTGMSMIDINSDYSTAYEHKYAIPLTVDPDSVYNVTIYLMGNWSTPNAHNATFDGLTVTSGNMASLEVFNTEVQSMNDTHRWRTLWILTLTGDHYLYVDLDRTGGFPYRNATMIVTLAKAPITKMSFNIPDLSSYSWSAAIHSDELLYNDTLLTEIPAEYVVFPPLWPGLDLILLLGGIAVGGLAIAAVIIYLTRRRGKYPT
ncbi:MAG: hypothetical protein ACFFDI_08880 [Promethearchaeota archaeon]